MQFRPGRPIYFGSSPECEMTLSDKTVSRRHLMAVWEGDTVLLRDQGSTNGTFVQGSRFKEIAIGFGAEFKLGRTVIKFLPEEEIVDPEPSDQSAFGHLIGMYDEYPAGACDPARRYVDEEGSVMKAGATVHERHVEEFRAWAEGRVGPVIGDVEVVRC